MPQEHHSTLDHWYDRPLVLDAIEMRHVAKAALGGPDRIDRAEYDALDGGLSGAFVMKVRDAGESIAVVARATTLARARRERFVLSAHPAAKSLWPGLAPSPIIHVPAIRRAYEVWVTVVRFIDGVPPDASDVRAEFSNLFDGQTLGFYSRRQVLRTAERLTRGHDEYFMHMPGGRYGFLGLVGLQRWSRGIVHGDPSVRNVIRRGGRLIAIDFASGGIGAPRLQRARFENSELPGSGAIADDPVAGALDAFRRLRAERTSSRAMWWTEVAKLHLQNLDQDRVPVGRNEV